jgi:hypothetical protein
MTVRDVLFSIEFGNMPHVDAPLLDVVDCESTRGADADLRECLSVRLTLHDQPRLGDRSAGAG